ncbi:Hypothetical predicted protein [Pelobates cultripes]|uniref:Uncharacterized protein n=1 Tax=Pelobates cultripes TaxID=61616 RepID=A0AAD1VLG3_PELCU|nr:Hypothetical predicted protein [Pelobates cultripes]
MTDERQTTTGCPGPPGQTPHSTIPNILQQLDDILQAFWRKLQDRTTVHPPHLHEKGQSRLPWEKPKPHAATRYLTTLPELRALRGIAPTRRPRRLFWRKLESRAHPPASQVPSSHLLKKQPQQGRMNLKAPTENRSLKWWRTQQRTLSQCKKTNVHMKHRQEHKAQMQNKNMQTYHAPVQPQTMQVSQLLSTYGYGDPHATYTQPQRLCRSGVG